MGLFGTSGIRGLYGEKITPQLAFNVGAALANTGTINLFVGHDHRLTSPLLSLSLQAGALAGGASVKNLGLCPTSVIAWNTKKRGGDSSAIITASHNPPEYNGIKLHNNLGAGFGKEKCELLEKQLNKKPYYPDWNAVDDSTSFDGINPYLTQVIEELGRENKVKVVLDCNHGAASVISPDLLMGIGCDIISINDTPDGTWRVDKIYENPKIGDWGRIADLQKLIDTVKKNDADLGVVHDGDADRVFFVTKDGPIIPDILMAAVAKVNKRDVVVSVDASMAIEEFTRVKRVPVGDVAISNQLLKEKEAWGGEPSGTFTWPQFSLCPDGIRSAALIISLWDKLNKELEKIPQYPIQRIRIPCPNEMKKKVLEDIERKAEKIGQISKIDGVRVKTDQGWFLIRPSGTEPVMRIVAEAYDEKSLKNLIETAKSLVSM